MITTLTNATMIRRSDHSVTPKGECGTLLLQLSVQEGKWEGDAVRHVLLFCKEQAVNNIFAIDVDGSHRSVRFWVSRRYVRMHLTSQSVTF